MTRNEAKEYANEREPDFLQRAKTISGRPSYVCPECGNGSGKDGTGIVRDPDSGKFKCFKCGLSEDVIGLWGRYTGTAGKEMFDSLYSHYGIQVDGQPLPAAPAEYQKKDKREQKPAPAPVEEDCTAFFLQANRDLGKTDYHRGISVETLNRFGVGYVERWLSPNAPAGVTPTPRLIIPTSKYSYLARDTRENIPEKQKLYAKFKAGKVRVFNNQALWNAKQPVFVVEGEIDALSVIDIGGEALALGSIACSGKLLEMIKQAGKKPAQPLILALDQDKDGQKAEERLADKLRENDISFYRRNIAGNYKDANERLTADRDGLTAAVAETVKEVAKMEEQKKEQSKEEKRAAYIAKESAAGYLHGFLDGIDASVNTPAIPTGFPTLDKNLDGGLYEGLYILGAVSSLGKTTLVMQMADNIAAAGTDVLIFSLEMARTELMAKSISRLTYLEAEKLYGRREYAKTTRGITAGERYANYTKEENSVIKTSIQDYQRYAEHVFIQEGIGDIGAAQIREAVKKHITITGKTPVVVVDYLQILAPAEPRATDKQNMDKAVLELKRLSRDFKLPVMAVSSFNRQNYTQAVSMAAFKESGAIEYSSDVLIGLQFAGTSHNGFTVTGAMKKNPRTVEARVLKNRNGAVGGKVDLDYRPLFNYFTEGVQIEEPESEDEEEES